MLLSRSFHRASTIPNIARSYSCYRKYSMAPTHKMSSPSDSRPIVISGPSGVGKGTLYKMLLDRHPSTFCTSISHTTRDPRPGEVRDQDYYYVTMAEFEDLIEKKGFVEHAKFGRNRYGTSRKMIDELSARGQIVVLDIEMEGVKQVKSTDLKPRFVFIAPPSFEALEKRLRGRGTEKEESIQERLTQAKNELAYSKEEGVHDIIIVNDDLESAYQELENYIYGNVPVTQAQSAKDGQLAGESVLD